MGQYWYPVSLSKREFVHPHKLAAGVKLWEQLANHPGTGAALLILCAAMPEVRGGGDFDLEENWHGPERVFPAHNTTPGPMPEEYAIVARRTIGRWAGDRIALVGDYAQDGDLPPEFEASKIYERCQAQVREEINDNPEGCDHQTDDGRFVHWIETAPAEFTDISDDVCRVIEHELNGKFSGTGWRHWKAAQPDDGDPPARRYQVTQSSRATVVAAEGVLDCVEEATDFSGLVDRLSRLCHWKRRAAPKKEVNGE